MAKSEGELEQLITLKTTLAQMGLLIKKEAQDIKIGELLDIVPVRLDQNDNVAGPVKRDTKIPIDRIRIIREKDGTFFANLFSPKATNPNFPYTFKKIPYPTAESHIIADELLIRNERTYNPPVMRHPSRTKPVYYGPPRPQKQKKQITTTKPYGLLTEGTPDYEYPDEPGHEGRRRGPRGEEEIVPEVTQEEFIPEHVPPENFPTPPEQEPEMPPEPEPQPIPPQPRAPERQDEQENNFYRIYIESYPVKSVEIKFYYDQRKDKNAPGIGIGSNFFVILANYKNNLTVYLQRRRGMLQTQARQLSTSIANAIMNVAIDFRTRVNSFGKQEDAEKWLKGQINAKIHPLVAGFSADVEIDRFVDWIIDALWVSSSVEWKERSVGNNHTAIWASLEQGVWLLEAQAEVKTRGPEGENVFRFERWDARAPDGTRIGTLNSGFPPEEKEDDRRLRLVLNYNEIPQLLPSLQARGHGQRPAPIRVTAVYVNTGIKHSKRPTVRGAYQGGAGLKDTALGALGMSGIRGRLSRDVKPREIKQDPFLLAAINKGKRQLNGFAKAEYTRVFNPLRAEFRRRAQELRRMQRDADDARQELRRFIRRQQRREAGYNLMQRNDEDMLNIATHASSAGGSLEGNVDLMHARDTLRAYLTARDRYFDDFKVALETASAHLRDYLVAKSGTISINLARQYKMALNSSDEDALKAALQDYSVVLAEDFVRRGRTIGHALMRGLGVMSRGLETGGAGMNNILYNIVAFIMGPWTLTTILVLINFFFIFTYVGYSIQLLWIMPMIGAAITFLLNFSDTFKPLDWVTHAASGALIGYASLLLMLIIATPVFNWGTTNIYFWIGWAVLGFIGLFQFYQNGGYKIVMEVSVFVLLFAYVAFGPYQAYYHQVIDQAKAPVEMAYRAVYNAVYDVYLLATDPTEWYARQQLVNVRPEHPLDYPKGLEVTMLDASPPSVAGGQPFFITSVIQNQGILDARDVMVAVKCNQWCDAVSASPQTAVPFSDLSTNPKYTKAWADVQSYGLANDIQSGKLFYLKDRMQRGESDAVMISTFGATYMPLRAAETNFAKVNVTISYVSSTNSSLAVSVISSDELNRRFTQGDTVFKPVTAVSKSTPAAVSLNVGPQPLKAGTNAILLVSVSNTRDSSEVILYKDSDILINMPKIIGSDLKCGDFSADTNKDNPDYWTVDYKIRPTQGNYVEILAYEFRSVFGFVCTFTASDANIGTIKTGYITAELPNYIFRIEQRKDIPITPPLGILYDPFEKVCNGISGQTACLARYDNKDQICWYQTAGANACHSCGVESARSCEKYKQPDCDTPAGSQQCNLDCTWVSKDDIIANGEEVPLNSQVAVEHGRCEANTESTTIGATSAATISAPVTYTPLQGTIVQRIVQAANQMKPPGADAQVKAEGIANSYAEMVLKLGYWESRFRQCISNDLLCTSDTSYSTVLCSLPLTDRRSSCGVMQIAININKDYKNNVAICGGSTGAYDVDCNIRIGIKILNDYYNQYKNGLSSVPCKTDPYKTKYLSYRGWKAALRAYNGWGCPANYPGGIAAAGDYVENLVKLDMSKYSQAIAAASQTAQSAGNNLCASADGEYYYCANDCGIDYQMATYASVTECSQNCQSQFGSKCTGPGGPTQTQTGNPAVTATYTASTSYVPSTVKITASASGTYSSIGVYLRDPSTLGVYRNSCNAPATSCAVQAYLNTAQTYYYDAQLFDSSGNEVAYSGVQQLTLSDVNAQTYITP